ncbi:MAG TPA: hypothetical protein VGL77_02290, partial [Armatimonadota bacterium]
MIDRLLRYTRVLLVLCCLGLLTHNAGAQAGRPPVNVLVLVNTAMSIDPALAQQLAPEGIQFVTRKLADPLSAEMLRQFHLVVIADWEGPKMAYYTMEFVRDNLNIRRNLDLIQQYIKDGGGFFFSPVVGGT